jgi:hypothetical protein
MCFRVASAHDSRSIWILVRTPEVPFAEKGFGATRAN